MFPSESQNRVEILAAFETDFNLAKQMIDACITTAVAIGKIPDAPYSKHVRAIVANILVREIRRFRSIVLECEIGHLENATTLLRSLMEGLLSVRFVLNDPIPLGKCSPKLKKARKKLPALPDVDGRADLYAAGEVLSMQNIASNDNGEAFVQAAELAKVASDAEQIIGPEWAAILTGGYSRYCGLSIKHQIENYGFKKLYGVFRVQCITTHANDSLRYINWIDGQVTLKFADLIDELGGISGKISFGTALLGKIVSGVASKFGLGESPELDAALLAMIAHAKTQDEENLP